MGLGERSQRAIDRMDGGLGPDARLVLDASAALDLKEFDLFRLAWRRWTGAEPDPARIESAFASYMFHHDAPPWVRHLAREVLRRQAAGRLRPNDFGADAFRPRVERPSRIQAFAATAAVSAAFLLAMFILATHVAVDESGNPLRLECSTGGMRFAEQVARQFTGKADPFDCRR